MASPALDSARSIHAKPDKLPVTPLHGAQLRFAAIGLSLATFMQVLDTTIANVSVPTIAGGLGLSAGQGVWVITSFSAASAISMPLTGRLAERFGQLRVFMSATVLFVIASFLCGISPSMQALVAARVLQGAVAGPLVPLSQALLLAVHPPQKRGQALSMWGAIVTVAPILGPILGGYISDNASWPWIFFINVPVGFIAVAFVWTTLHRVETPRARPPLDIVGLLLLALWVGSLQIMLDKGQDEAWFESRLIVALAAISAIAFGYFLIWELGDRHPIVHLALFRNRNFLVGAGGAALLYGAFFGVTVLLPLVLQTQLGYTATWAGLVLAPVGLLPVMASRIIGRNMYRLDPRVLVSSALLVVAAVMLMRSRFTSGVDFTTLVMPQFILGLGLLLMQTPLSALTLSQLKPHETAAALGLVTFLRYACGSFGASLLTSLWQDREALHHTRLVEALASGRPATGQTLQMLTQHGFSFQQAYAVVEAALSQQSFIMAANDVFWVSAGFICMLVGIVWFAKPPFNYAAAPAAPAE